MRTGWLVDPERARGRVAELRQALAKLKVDGHKLGMPSFHGLLAELEATQSLDSVLTPTDEGLAMAKERVSV